MPRKQTLAALAQRFATTQNAGIRACILDVCASALVEAGEDFELLPGCLVRSRRKPHDPFPQFAAEGGQC